MATRVDVPERATRLLEMANRMCLDTDGDYTVIYDEEARDWVIVLTEESWSDAAETLRVLREHTGMDVTQAGPPNKDHAGTTYIVSELATVRYAGADAIMHVCHDRKHWDYWLGE